MSTRSIIALPDGKGGFRGRYVHSDGYPDGVGAQVRKILERDGLEEAARVLVHENYSWSSIQADQTDAPNRNGRAVPGYGIVHLDGRDLWCAPEHNSSWANWAYVLQPEGVAVWDKRDGSWINAFVMDVDESVSGTVGSESSIKPQELDGLREEALRQATDIPCSDADASAAVSPYGVSAAANGLEARARIAARNRAVHAGQIVVRDRDWRRREVTATRLACAVLGIDQSNVTAAPDHDRYALFGWVDVRLIVTGSLRGPSSRPGPDVPMYEFICEVDGGSAEALLLLRPCPECQRMVPTYCIRALADLGEVILADQSTTFHRLRPNARQYPTDPAHQQNCSIYRRTPN